MQSSTQPLPPFLLERYRRWKVNTHDRDLELYDKLATEGQSPKAMLISCCDSRVQITSIFEADPGDFFVVRNVANLVPPHEPDGLHHGAAAAIEYAVTVLKVAHVIVIGHSQCGGVKGCFDMCEGNAPALMERTSFVGRWMDLLRRGYDRLPADASAHQRVARLEREGVVVSLENLMTFPFVAEAVEAGRLSLHGLWTDIKDGELEAFDPETGQFQPV